MSLPDKIRLLMLRKGLSQEALGKALGVTHASVSGWLSGAVPRQSRLQQVAAFFGITVDELTNDEVEIPPERPHKPAIQGPIFEIRSKEAARDDKKEASELKVIEQMVAVAFPLPSWWERVPSVDNRDQLQAACPEVFARLHRAAELIVEGDRLADHGKKRRPEHLHPLVDAFADLKLQGTNFTRQPERSECLFRAYQDMCNRLRYPEHFKPPGKK